MLRIAMSRAVVICLLWCRPEALRNVVLFIPRWRAVLVICLAKARSLPPSFSATATATSFADLIARDSMAVRTVIVFPGRNPSLEGGCRAARREILILESSVSFRRSRVLNNWYSVIILVRDAGCQRVSLREA